MSTAHRSGIVHRDLKPANVMLTKSGAKLLDFGLARLIRRSPAEQATLSRLTTESEGLTEPGTILGTWQYMAPEQLEGSEADVRTDIFALGTVIFEMATGRPAFTGKSKASVIASILSSTPPPVSQFQKICPPLLDHLVRKCLEKDPDQRWQSAHDVASELKWTAETQSELSSGEPRRTIRERLFITATIVALGVLLALAFAYWKAKPEAAATLRLSLLPPEGLSFNGLALSPDGRHLAFTATGTREKQGLWVRSFDSQADELLPGTQDAHDPFWSPDGSAIAFFTKDKLKRVYPSGGTPEILCNVPNAWSGTWSKEGIVLFSAGDLQPIQQLTLNDCSIKPATRIDESHKEVTHAFPHFLPDGRHFLLVVLRLLPDKGLDIYVGSLEKNERQLVVRNASAPSYVSPGCLVFAREGKLLAQAFDAGILRTRGEPFPVVQEHVASEHFFGSTLYSVSQGGTLVYAPNMPVQFQLQWLDRRGKMLEPLTESGFTRTVQISPNEKRVLVNRFSSETEIGDAWICETPFRTWSRFTFDPTSLPEARWSPDGRQIVYMSRREGIFRLERKPSDGSGAAETLLESPRWVAPRSWSPDGRSLLYGSVDPETGFDLWLLPLTEDRKPTAFVRTRFNEGNATFAPNGKLVAYVSDKSGENEIYVKSFGESQQEWQISNGTALCPSGGCAPAPRWRADGKELFYISADWQVMAAPITIKRGFQAGIPQALFALTEGSQFDVTSDGQRFLVNTPVQRIQSTPLNVILNWTAQYKLR